MLLLNNTLRASSASNSARVWIMSGSCTALRIGGLHICLLQVPGKGVLQHHA